MRIQNTKQLQHYTACVYNIDITNFTPFPTTQAALRHTLQHGYQCTVSINT